MKIKIFYQQTFYALYARLSKITFFKHYRIFLFTAKQLNINNNLLSTIIGFDQFHCIEVHMVDKIQIILRPIQSIKSLLNKLVQEHIETMQIWFHKNRISFQILSTNLMTTISLTSMTTSISSEAFEKKTGS